MFVLNEDEYKEYKRYKATLEPKEIAVKCSICGREFPNENILAHHLKSHVAGFKCNICGKVFQHNRSLTAHLKKHAPQVEPSKYSVLDSNMPHQAAPPLHFAAPPMHSAAPPPQRAAPPLHRPAPPLHRTARKPHKHKSVLNFEVKKWLTLK